MISQAIDPNATRTTSAEIETYLTVGAIVRDIDGDGEVKPLTDGFLVLRYLFGFRNDALTNNAIDPNASRKTSVEVESYIEANLP